jgi:hypothetical protein
MKWAFVDYENVNNLDKVELANYEKIIIFLGAKQPKLDFGSKKYDKLLNFVIIQMKAVQANNLDFHLAYYLGKYDSLAEKQVAFEVISNDNGYSPLISHVKANGRSCKQVKIESPSQSENKLITSLTSKPKDKRPKKIISLKNHIASHLGLKGNEIAIQNQVNYLVNAKVISVSNGTSIEYLM